MKIAVALIKNVILSILVVFTAAELKKLGLKNKYLLAFKCFYLTPCEGKSFVTQKISYLPVMNGFS